jgi:hypothetical protein
MKLACHLPHHCYGSPSACHPSGIPRQRTARPPFHRADLDMQSLTCYFSCAGLNLASHTACAPAVDANWHAATASARTPNSNLFFRIQCLPRQCLLDTARTGGASGGCSTARPQASAQLYPTVSQTLNTWNLGTKANCRNTPPASNAKRREGRRARCATTLSKSAAPAGECPHHARFLQTQLHVSELTAHKQFLRLYSLVGV